LNELALKLRIIFINANQRLLERDIDLFKSEVSERTLCGALKEHIDFYLHKTEYANYYTDVEYNRNRNGKVKTCCPFIEDNIPIPVTINCDLIIHSRGKIISQDNLLAIEMKKSTRSKKDKDNDRLRLIALTKDSYDNVWSFDGNTLPEHICRYKLGIYYEINYAKKFIKIEYYYKGNHLEYEDITIRF